MRKFVLFVSCLLTLSGLLFTATSADAKLSRTEKKKFGTPMQLLSFEQLGKLEMNQRVRYVRQLRETFREFERFQRMFGRQYAFQPKTQEESELYALLFGSYAYAADVQGRGLYASDKCIYGYQLSKFPSTGSIQPGMCEIPKTAQCRGVSGAGVQCGYEVSGLRTDMKEACIPRGIAYRATEECDLVREQKISENKTNIQSAIAKAKEIFKVGDDKASIKKSTLTSAEAMGALRDLMNYAYDDETYAHMLWVLSLYKKEGINVDFEKLDPVFKGITLNRFAGSFDNSQIRLNEAFNDFKNHCDSDIDPKVLAALQDPNWQREVDRLSRGTEEQGGDSFWVREKKRREIKEAYDKVVRCQNSNTGDCGQLRAELGIPAGQKIEFKVKYALEPWECRKFEARYDKIGEIYDRIAGSFPAVDPDQPQSEPAPPPKPPTPDYIATATGCSRRVNRDVDLLAQASAQCLICAAEKSVSNTADQFDTESEEYTDRAYNVVSRKWMSFLSTMVLACGDGKAGNKIVDMPNMLLYMQTFGHCDAGKYEWTLDEKSIGSSDRDNLEKWQTDQSYWINNKDKNLPPDDDNSFARIYGIKYKTASKLFCDKDRFKKTWFGRLKELDVKKDRKGVRQFMEERRKAFRETRKVVKPDRKAEHSAANALLECMDQATERADELYVEGSGQCMAATDANVASGAQIEAFRDSVHNADQGVAIYNNAACSIHHLNEAETATGISRAGFYNPAKVPDGTSPYATIKIGADNTSKRPTEFTTHADSGTTTDTETIRNDFQIQQFRSFTYVSDAGCPVPAGIGIKAGKKGKQKK